MIVVYINLDFEAKKPIYKQLKHQIIAGIAKQEILPGERLPSIRSLAADIGINLNTVNKTYQQLRQEGFILIHRQRGVVANPDGPPAIDEAYRKNLREALHPLIAESICRGMDQAEILQLSKEIIDEFKVAEGDDK